MKIKILIRILIYNVLTIFLFWSISNAANRLYYENFDDQAIDAPSVGSITTEDGAGIITPPAYNLTTVGRGGSGYCYSSGTSRDALLVWTYGTNWPTNQMYVSFWMRYPTFTYRNDNMNIKFFYPHWTYISGNNYVVYAVSGPTPWPDPTNMSVYYVAVNQGVDSTVATPYYYLPTPNMVDGDWHHYEFFVDFPNGISKFWYDSVLIFNRTYNENWGNTPVMLYLTFGAQDSEEVDEFSRQIDDIEVYDGMPSSMTLGTGPAGKAGTGPGFKVE